MSVQDRARLDELGWDQWFTHRFASVEADGVLAGRVVADHGLTKAVHTGDRVRQAEVARRLSQATPGADPVLPAVGDWVVLRSRPGLDVVEAVLERRTAFRRRAASYGSRESQEQVLAANVDVVFIMVAADSPRNVRRIERYLAVASGSGARPVVLLSKADLASSLDQSREQAEAVSAGIPVIAVSSVSGLGIEEVRASLGRGQTGVLLGPSGSGKSTLLNALLGTTAMLTGEVRADGKGRHTTSHRQLFRLPDGGLLIDTPGLRELQLWTDDIDLERLFADVEELAAHCRFSDCGHDREPDCAVKDAIAEGRLSPLRLRSYRLLQEEGTAVERHVASRRNRAVNKAWRRYIADRREDDLRT